MSIIDFSGDTLRKTMSEIERKNQPFKWRVDRAGFFGVKTRDSKFIRNENYLILDCVWCDDHMTLINSPFLLSGCFETIEHAERMKELLLDENLTAREHSSFARELEVYLRRNKIWYDRPNTTYNRMMTSTTSIDGPLYTTVSPLRAQREIK